MSHGCWRILPGICVMLAAWSAGGCFLDPRQAETPAVEPPVDFNQPIDPETVLGNIEAGLEARWIDNYKLSFHEGALVMEMDSGEYAEAGVSTNPFVDWTRDKEAQTMVQVFNSMSDETTLDIQWDSDPESKWKDNSWYDDLTYSLTFTEGATTVVYAGKVDLYFVEDNSLWYIVRWEDLTDGDNHTWCYLRFKQTWNPAK